MALFDKINDFAKAATEKTANFAKAATEKTENAMAEASRQLATVRSRLTEGDGNLISQAEKLRKLGVTAQKQLSRKMLDEAEESD